MSEEWGPWIDDRLPEVGQDIEVEALHIFSQEKFRLRGRVVRVEGFEVDLDPDPGGGWTAIRYRVRRPRGLRVLEGILRRITGKVDA